MKRKLSIVLSVTMSLALMLSACSGDNKNSEPTATIPPASSQAVEPTNTGGGESKMFPLKEQVKLSAFTWRTALGPEDFNDQELIQRLEKQTNVHVEWETVVETDYLEKKNLYLSTGNLPDMFFAARFQDTELLKYGKDGTIIPLNDLIDKHMPNLKALFERRPDIKALSTAPDGNIYSLPAGEEMGKGQSEIGANPDFLYINQDWLDNLKLKMPTTLEEYHEVLKAFKTQDPNGNKKADEIPLTYIDNFWTGDIGVLFGAFGVPDKTYRPNNFSYLDHINVENGKVSFAPLDPRYKDAVSYFHQWFKEDLVDIEAFTHDYGTYFARGKTEDETIGSMIWWDKTDVVGSERDKHWVIVPPFKDMVVKWNSGSDIQRAGTVITKENKNPDVTAAWLDTMYDPIVAAEARFGPIGVWFVQDANGKLNVKKDIDSPGEFKQKSQVSNGIGVLTIEDFEKVDYMEERGKQRIEDTKNIFVPQMQKEKFPNLFFNEEELQKIDRLKPELQAYVNTTRAKWLFKGGAEKEYDEFVSTLKDMGIDELIQIHQAAYDRYQANLK